jgi:hypothetical protein
MSIKVGNFLSRVVIHFPVRFDSDERESEWLRSIVEAVGYYDADVLDAAAQKIIDTRTDRRFPLPAEIRKVCQSIVEEKRGGLVLKQEVKQANPWSKERTELANMLVMNELGRQAARDGWISSLHNFVRLRMRVPHEHEIPDLKRKAMEFDEAYVECIRGGWPIAKALEKLGREMLKRREELRTMVLGDAA